ncbi:MAG: helix-turn-helix transcriptional regulator [Oscillospiraceae bacterium]|nr:helix-turn-helix transcriptional regulator [Oscillospiraceae bacterium]
MEIYEILRGLREDRDLTQQELADFLKIGRTMYRRYETGVTEIPTRHLKSLCLFYGISSDYILDLPENLPYGTSKTRK